MSGETQPVEPRIRARVLSALTLALALLFAMFVYSTFRSFASRRNDDMRRTAEHASSMLELETDRSVDAMKAAASVILLDPILTDALDRRDREALLDRAGPILRDLREHTQITHFYFHDPARVNVVRIHEPTHHGDKIGRITLLEAELTGEPAFGNEQGPFGAYTLRYVIPWRSGERLLGYLELGKELEDIAVALRAAADVEITIFIDKQFVKREIWEQELGGEPGLPPWDAFPSIAAVFSTDGALPPEIRGRLAGERLVSGDIVSASDRDLQCVLLPVVDVKGRAASRMLVVRDVTAMAVARRAQLIRGSVAIILVSAALIAGFYVFLGRIQRDLRAGSRLVTETNARLEGEIVERASAQAKLEEALEAAETASKAMSESLSMREEAVRELRGAKLDLERQLQTIELQRGAIRALSAPIIDVWEGVLTVPMVGVIDEERAADIVERLLRRVSEARARWVILDLTGLPAIDATVAGAIGRLSRAARLLGCGCVVTGISPEVARAFTELGADLGEALTMRTLKEAIQRCTSAVSGGAWGSG